ncbi:MAG: AMP-binding protein [bacterium]
MTLDGLLERATKSNPEKLALISREGDLTYRQLNNQVSALANGLLNLGLRRGDRVAMLLPKCNEAVIAFLGVIRAGGIIAPINMRQKPNTLRVNFRQMKPFAVISEPLYFPILKKHFLQVAPTGRIILTGSNQHVDSVSFNAILEKESEQPPNLNHSEQDVVYLNYTSGTTGLPKGAITTNGNLFWNTKGAVEMLRLNERDVHMSMFAMYAHPHELFCRSIYLSGTAVLLESMYPKTIARAIEEFGVTCLMAVPPFFKSVFPVAKAKEFDLSSLRIPEGGGVYSPPEFCKEFEDIFQKRFIPVWGSTETSGIALATSPYEDHRLGSLGKPCPGYEVHVLHPGGREADTDEVGELVISGSGVVQGYFNLIEETEKNFHHGACHTGDMVRRDADGFYHFLGRRSGLMKVAGLKVYPTEVEMILQKHPLIEEAAVVSLPDALRGEIPKAFVVLKSSASLDVKEIRSFCLQHLADYKVPQQIEIRSELPKTESGKISYVELAQEARDTLADDEVKSLQRRVNSIDSKILELLNSRVELVMRMMVLRGKKDQPVYSLQRSDEIIARMIEENRGPIYDEAVEEIFKKIIELSLIIQS